MRRQSWPCAGASYTARATSNHWDDEMQSVQERNFVENYTWHVAPNNAIFGDQRFTIRCDHHSKIAIAMNIAYASKFTDYFYYTLLNDEEHIAKCVPEGNYITENKYITHHEICYINAFKQIDLPFPCFFHMMMKIEPSDSDLYHYAKEPDISWTMKFQLSHPWK